jgi:lipopolysaccharide export system permease protein
VLALLGFSDLNYLPVLLSLTLFVTVLMALSRSYRDSEMVIWFSAGQSLIAWVTPVLTFALPLVGLIAVLSLFLSPWAVDKSDEFRRRMESRDELSRVAPGVFREAGNADRVFFVEEIAGEENKVQNVFISQVQQGRLGILASKSGFKETAPNGDRFVVLINGRRYEGVPGTAAYRVMGFERYAMRVETSEARLEQASTKAMSTVALISSRSNGSLAELLWRISLPISALMLALLAIPLSFVNPRASRSINLVFALYLHGLQQHCFDRSGLGVFRQARFGPAGGRTPPCCCACSFWRRLRVSSGAGGDDSRSGATLPAGSMVRRVVRFIAFLALFALLI